MSEALVGGNDKPRGKTYTLEDCIAGSYGLLTFPSGVTWADIDILFIGDIQASTTSPWVIKTPGDQRAYEGRGNSMNTRTISEEAQNIQIGDPSYSQNIKKVLLITK